MREEVLQIQNISKRIGKKTIIDQLSFSSYTGEILGFLGPNGSGKTTTIRMIVGLMSIDSGQIIIKGHHISKQFEQAIGHVGAIVENPEMYKYLTGYQNLLHFAKMHPNVTNERIQAMIELVGLERRIHEKVSKYSLGMKQRLGIAQALLHKPSILILDEPTNGLDPAGIRELRDYLRQIVTTENISIIVSSHLLAEMELMCDRVVIIQAGRLIETRSLLAAPIAENSLIEIEFTVDRTQDAIALLEEKQLKFDVVGNDRIKFEATREQIAEWNATFVSNGIKVYEMRQVKKSLEDQFMEITGGEQVV